MRPFSHILFLNLVLLLLPVIEFSSYSQNDYKQLKDNFLYAEHYLSVQQYREALPLYLSVYQNDSMNANINYRIGQCYINIRGEKLRSIPYLERASKNISAQYIEGEFESDVASLEALFLLGESYQRNNQLDKALQTFLDYKDLLQPKDSKNIDKAENKIHSISIAKQEINNPVDIRFLNLGSNINSRFSDYNPVVSGDQNLLVFTSFWESADLILQSNYIDGEWSEPVNITEELGSEGDCYTGAISNDGMQLYLIKQGNYNSDIYVSYNKDNRWTPMQKLNKRINSNDQETSISISTDGNTIYFSSNRPGGEGGFDIYKSEKDNGEWCKPVNLGNIINTSYNEEAPCILSDCNILLFSSEGHRNMGGMDIFCSQLTENGIWSEPKNMGSPINTTDDDLFLWYIKDRNISYFSRFDASGFGKHDIFKFETEIEKIIIGNAMADKSVSDSLMNNPAITENITYNEEPYIQNPENSQIKYNDEQSEEKIPYYTIQIMALHKPVSTRYFKNLDSVKVHKGDDFISRYTCGKFYGYTPAREYLEKVHNLGYSDAFIREINSISNYYENTSKE